MSPKKRAVLSEISVNTGNIDLGFDDFCTPKQTLKKTVQKVADKEDGGVEEVWLLFAYISISSLFRAPNLPKLTAGIGLLAWLGVFLASSGLIFFYRCSSKDPDYIRMNLHGAQNMKDDEPLVKIDISNSALLDGNWSLLCPTCKDF